MESDTHHQLLIPNGILSGPAVFTSLTLGEIRLRRHLLNRRAHYNCIIARADNSIDNPLSMHALHSSEAQDGQDYNTFLKIA